MSPNPIINPAENKPKVDISAEQSMIQVEKEVVPQEADSSPELSAPEAGKLPDDTASEATTVTPEQTSIPDQITENSGKNITEVVQPETASTSQHEGVMNYLVNEVPKNPKEINELMDGILGLSNPPE